MMTPYRGFVEKGALMAYSVDLSDLYRGSANYVDRILRGTSPGEAAYQLPTKFALVINLEAAKVLGLTIPPSVLAQANQTIE